MKQIYEYKNLFGGIKIFENIEKKYLLICPFGIIGPSIIKKDLLVAKKFGENFNGEWDYIVDTSKVKIANPINLLYLSKIKALPKLRFYIIYAPSFVVQILSKLTFFLVRPDKVLKSHSEFRECID